MRIIKYQGVYWGPPVLGNYLMVASSGSHCSSCLGGGARKTLDFLKSSPIESSMGDRIHAFVNHAFLEYLLGPVS